MHATDEQLQTERKMRSPKKQAMVKSTPWVNVGIGFMAVLLGVYAAACARLISGPGIPAITNVTAGSVTVTGATITWTTDIPSSSQVEYGTTTSYGSTTVLDATMVTSHQEPVTGLKPGTLYHYRVHSTSATTGSSVGGDQALTTLADTTPPTVSITAPAAGATISGSVTVTATASDNVAVATVQFKVDGTNAGVALTAAPYSTSLNTTNYTNGSHTLTAVATDTSGNATTSAGIAVTISNSATAPTISSLSPASGPVGGSVAITGTNFGATQGTSTVTFNGTAGAPTSWSATSIGVPVPTGATTGNVVVTVAAVASNGVAFTVTTGSTAMGPLVQSGVNSRYFVTPGGQAVFLSGSHTWDDFQDTDTNVGSTPAAFNLTAYISFLKTNNHNVTIVWHKDLPEYCGWNFSGSVWRMTPWPWMRPGPGVATDGNPKFDLTQLNQPYFDRLRAEVQQLQANGIYAIVELFDANQLTSARCSTDGYPFTLANNINSVDDGYSSGASGTNSVTMTAANAITGFQDTYVKKVIDTVNDLPNVIYEVAEEQPAGSGNWWFPHVISLVKTYESTKPFQHPVGIGSMNATAPSDSTLYSSAADWIAPTINTNFSNQFPSNVAVNNQGKVVINDSDHALGYSSFLNSNGTVQDQNLRGYLWENITQGAEGLVFMDPYEIFWQGTIVRNTCLSPVNQVCIGGVDPKYNNFRASMGYAQAFVNSKMDLLKATPQGSLASTGFCLADNAATGAEYLVYAPSGGTFTVNLSATTRALNVLWLNPATGAATSGTAISGGLAGQSFTAPFSGDAVLYIVDALGHN
jgi:hypothetical protein